MGDVVSADVLDWARDLAAVRVLLAQKPRPMLAGDGKVVQLALAPKQTEKAAA
jgi:hypothetical protein